MNLKSFLPLSLLLLIFACSSDDSNNNDDTNQDNILIKQINYSSVEANETYMQVFEYDGNKLISLVDSSSDMNEEYEATFEYADNKLVQVNYRDDGQLVEYVTLSYDSEDILTEFTAFLFDVDGGNVATKYIVTLNDNNSNISLELFRGDFSSQTENVGTTNYTIMDGNIIEISNSNNSDTVNFQYDSKNSVYKNIFSIDFIALVMNESENGFEIYGSGNNITQITDDQGDFMDIETIEYSYNTNDYPNAAMYYYDGELDSNIEFIYE
jgi:hypothetical protein